MSDDPNQPIPAPEGSEVAPPQQPVIQTRRRSRPQFVPVDADHDGRVDTIAVDRTGDGIIDENDDPSAPVYEMTYRGNRVKVAVLDVEQPPPPPRPSMDDVLADIKAGYESRIDRLWKWIKGIVGGISVSVFAYIAMTLYYGSLWWFVAVPHAGPSHSEQYIRKAIYQDASGDWRVRQGSWGDGLHPEELLPAIDALEADAKERED